MRYPFIPATSPRKHAAAHADRWTGSCAGWDDRHYNVRVGQAAGHALDGFSKAAALDASTSRWSRGRQWNGACLIARKSEHSFGVLLKSGLGMTAMSSVAAIGLAPSSAWREWVVPA